LEQLNALRSLGRFDLIERDALGAGVALTVVGEETPPISRQSIHFRELPPFVRISKTRSPRGVWNCMRFS
jgi:hypothetical protein